MKFRKGVEGTPGLESAFCEGLQALQRRDRKKIVCANGAKLTGSADIDSALRKAQPNAPRWDYAIGMHAKPGCDRVVWIEVHPAASSNVKDILAKLSWLKTWLDSAGNLLKTMDRRILWVASGPVAIPRGSPQLKRLAAAGLQLPKRHIDVESVWTH